jgi:DNA/RNA-binding domain of Phe-tRNA-synthetase-like protein
MTKAPEPDPKPAVFLGKDTSPDAIREAAIQIWRSVYRHQHGIDPTPEFEAEVRRLRRERETDG